MLKEFFSKQLATVSDRSIHWQEARIRVLTAPLDHSQFTKLLISCWAGRFGVQDDGLFTKESSKALSLRWDLLTLI